MIIHYATLETCGDIRDAVVVIDVVRAFTTAAYAFGAGAKEILLVSSVAEAFDLREKQPELLLMGEVDGLPIDGFDFGNSPSVLERLSLRGRRIVHRTSAGTQGAVACRNASLLLAASFVCAQATADYIRTRQLESVAFVITGARRDRDGDDDQAGAEYIAALVGGENPPPEPYLERVEASFSGRIFSDPAQPEFSLADLECALELDRYPFAMKVERQNERLVL